MHETVFLDEAVEFLALKKDAVVVDATFGEGGHSRKVLESLGSDGKLIAFDKDSDAIEKMEELKKLFFNMIAVHSDFNRMKEVLHSLHIFKVNAILFDLGLCQRQIDESGRGFSFTREEVLDMRMNIEDALTAREIVNSYSEKELADLIYEWGEDFKARRIAGAIAFQRQKKPIETSLELAELIKRSVRNAGKYKIHPATRTFQALRIAVNDELKSLESVLDQAIEILEPNGRLVVISFHSLEDRIAKHKFRAKEKDGMIRILTKKPLQVSDEERHRNPRARSAKMRVIEKAGDSV